MQCVRACVRACVCMRVCVYAHRKQMKMEVMVWTLTSLRLHLERSSVRAKVTSRYVCVCAHVCTHTCVCGCVLSPPSPALCVPDGYHVHEDRHQL